MWSFTESCITGAGGKRSGWVSLVASVIHRVSVVCKDTVFSEMPLDKT
jgi:hypothetical protein